MLIFVHLVSAVLLFFGSCNHPATLNNKVKGDWKSKDGSTHLKITADKFMEDTGTPVVAEDYFVKGDTIFTSFEGNQPYTKFVIKQADEHHLKLLYPDSAIIAFVK